jgi:cytoskeletal protein CcmA (bactofilin family)
VSTNGLVEADIDVAVAQIHGAVKGDIIASKRIEMGRVARVNGNIFTPSLVVEQGAHFEGSCRMADRPSSRQEARKKMKELGITSGVAGS